MVSVSWTLPPASTIAAPTRAWSRAWSASPRRSYPSTRAASATEAISGASLTAACAKPARLTLPHPEARS